MNAGVASGGEHMQNVLIVSNEMDRIRDLTAGLSRAGFSCTACVYADDVIEQDLRQMFNAVLVDISAVSPHGDSAWKWYRKLKLRRPLPIIALVSSGTLQMVVGEQGIDDLIMKPWNLDELSARIAACVQGQWGQGGQRAEDRRPDD